MKRSPARILGLALAGLVVSTIVWAFLPKPVAVDFGTVTRGPMQVTVDEDGVTRIKERHAVASPLFGRLRRVELEAGDTVRAGKTLLAVIEPADPQLLDARTRRESTARVRAAQAAVEETSANLERIRASHELAASELKRARQLFETGVMARSELEHAETNERVAAKALQAARFAVQIAEFELEQARANLLHSAADPSAAEGAVPFEIRSPIDGRVLRVWQESATIVAPGTPLLELGDPADLEIVVDVLSADGVKIRPGAEMILEHWGGPEPLRARVRLVEPAAFLKISALGVEEQRVNVLANLVHPPDQRPTLGDAFRVEARIVIWADEDVLKVPTSALFRRRDRWAVFVFEDDRARLRLLDIDHQNGLETEVIRGLSAGERVILHPDDRLRDGARVRERIPGTNG